MKPVVYIQYSFGIHKIYYITEDGRDLESLPSVKCFCPTKDIPMFRTLKRLDEGIYYFEADFKEQGNHLFIYYEATKRTGILNALVRPY